MNFQILAIIITILGISLIFLFIFLWSKRHRDFISNANEISQGMTYDEVLSIMKVSPTSTEEDGDKKIAIWEKNQWKGIQNGGTLTRSVKVVFKDDVVVSISNKNLDKSTFY